MKVSHKGLAELLSHEAIVTRRYKDSVGVWTYGVGHTKGAGAPDPVTITEDQPVSDAIAVFLRDIVKYETAVERALKREPSQEQFDAMVSFHFNTGAIGRASLTKKFNAGDVAGAATAFMAYKKPPEIIDRRKAEQRLFERGIYSNDGRVTVYPASNGGRVLWGKGKRVPVADLLNSGPVGEALPVRDAKVDYHATPIVEDIQKSLKDFGYPEVGEIDGEWGDRTRAAQLAYRADRMLPLRKDIDALLIADMVRADEEGWYRPVAKSRLEATKAEVMPHSVILQTSWWGKLAAAVGLGGGVIGETAKQAFAPEGFEQRMSVFQRVLDFAKENFVLLIGVGGAFVAVIVCFQIIDRMRVKAHREGRTF